MKSFIGIPKLRTLALLLAVSIPALGGPVYAPVGPQNNVSIATVTGGGWTQCFSEPYGTFGTSISGTLAGCNGDLLMMAGGQNNSGTLSVLAWAPEVDVTFATAGNATHNANGSGWYNAASWGFAPQGAPINLSSCDIAASTSFGGVDATTPLRLCWHRNGDTLNGGWRVGAADFLNGEPSGYTRYLFTADSNAVGETPEPGTVGLMLSGIGLLALRLRSRRKN